ncbi:MAG: hypothetical protein MHMPM18_004238 [Marteilia pararefringens]
MKHFKYERGAAVYILIVVIAIVGFLLARGAEYMALDTEKKKGAMISDDIYSIIDSWSRTMDYLCVNGTANTISVSDIQMSKRMSNFAAEFSMKTTLPPNPTLEIEVASLSDAAQIFLIKNIESRYGKLAIAPVISINTNNGVVKVTAKRGRSAAESVAFGSIKNANVVNTSILLGGVNQYGMDGC